MRISTNTALVCPLVLASALSSVFAQSAGSSPRDVVIKNAIVMTVTHGNIKNGSVYIKDGKIAAVGETVDAPASATVIDAQGKYLTPGIVDCHSHIALDNDVNEATSPITPQMMMKDAFNYQDKEIYRALAGGVTTSLLLHGSANMIGGQAVVIKHKYGDARDALLFPNAPGSIKFASGENPKRVYGGRDQLPSTRMGNFAVQRQALVDGQDYMREWDNYNEKVKRGDKDASPPKHDLKLEALADVLRGKLMVQIHCYRADEMLTEMAMAKEFGYNLRAFHHALEALQDRRSTGRQQHRHRHLRRLVGLQAGGMGRHSMECCDGDAQGRAGRYQKRLRRLHPPLESGSCQDYALRGRNRRRRAEDDHAQRRVDHWRR